MTKPKVLVLTGYGINCEEETKFAFEKAGALAEVAHINDVIDRQRKLADYQILAFPGGFSYGDDTGSGNAYANRVRNHLWNEVREFAEQDRLVVGICNGFQILANLGLVPALNQNCGERQAALVHNDNARYTDRWVDLEFEGKSPWIDGLTRISMPIAHGEGKFYADPKTLKKIEDRGLVAARYVQGGICDYLGLPANPNGSLNDIAAISDESGKILGMMPHPERAIDFTQLPNWTYLKEIFKQEGMDLPSEADGITIFKNGVGYFR